ncbi:MAG: hypothetical protein Q9167_000062 [Letrouitia subvulpina]
MLEDPDKLRLELKQWEKAFAAANGGRRATREDIKQHPHIGLYRYISEIAPDSKLSKTTYPQTTSTRTPEKQDKFCHLERRATTQLPVAFNTEHVTPKKHRMSIGPTPQKNGRVLGLFDLLSPSSIKRTPSKKPVLQQISPNKIITPSKRRNHDQSGINAESSPASKDQKSPLDASKRMCLSSFLTPSVSRSSLFNENVELEGSVPDLQLEGTPVFLQRHSQLVLHDQQCIDDDDTWHPVAFPVGSKPAGRGLSTLVKGLRDMEDRHLDEEMELQREIENELDSQNNDHHTTLRMTVKDSQVTEMPLGPDGGAESDDANDDNIDVIEKDSDDRLLTTRKRGQKRKTKKVAMKPCNVKWKPEPEWKAVHGEDERGTADPVGTQMDDVALRRCCTRNATSIETNDRDSCHEQEQHGHGHENPNHKQLDLSDQRANLGRKSAGTKRKKKISSTAHANFRALKIRKRQANGRDVKYGRRR